MILLGLDFETTWTTPVNPRLARPIEVGAVVWNAGTKESEISYSELIFDPDHPSSPKELVALTGITDAEREVKGVHPIEAFKKLNALMDKCDYVVAHNGNEFDKIIYEEECARLGTVAVEKPWIDTKVDIPYPDSIKTRKLVHLWAEHELENAHRAVFDVEIMLGILARYDIQEIINFSKQDTITVIASVSYQDRQLAKDRGYYWDGENKRWKKQMKEEKAQKEKEEAPFPVQLLMS